MKPNWELDRWVITFEDRFARTCEYEITDEELYFHYGLDGSRLVVTADMESIKIILQDLLLQRMNNFERSS